MPLRIGNTEPAGLAIGGTLIRGAAIGNNIIFNLGGVTPADNLGIITISNIGSGQSRTAALVVTDADGFTTMPTGTVMVRTGADSRTVSTTTLSFSGSGNARSAALPTRRQGQRYRVNITYNDSNGAHQLQIFTTRAAFSTVIQYEVRT